MYKIIKDFEMEFNLEGIEIGQPYRVKIYNVGGEYEAQTEWRETKLVCKFSSEQTAEMEIGVYNLFISLGDTCVQPYCNFCRVIDQKKGDC